MLTCDCCDKQTEDVVEIKDPYLDEVYGETRYITVCEECYNTVHDT